MKNTTAKKKKPAPKAKPKAKAKEPQVEVSSELGPHAERSGAAIACTQCEGTIDSGTIRIVIEAGAALHPSCTFGWTLDHFPNTTATADWMAQMMQRSRLSPEDRAELLAELGA